MHIPNRWLWYAYFYVYALFVGYWAVEFFRPDSAVYVYYHFLLAFRPYFLIPYSLHLLTIIVSLLSLAPFYSHVSGLPSFSPSFARCLFFARIILEGVGRSYEIKALQALGHHKDFVPWIIIAAYILFNLGSYWAHYRYAFRRVANR